MTNKSYRIKIDVGNETEKNIKINLEQDIQEFDVLSLKLTQDDIYSSTNSDFGVIIGRVIANGGVGVPNAKISIFIPVSEIDKNNPDVYSLYPYETPRDKNIFGKRYNLLPRVSRLNKDGIQKPKQPFGSMPIKEEVLTNNTYLEIYEKYFKFNTVTNDSGDYMIFGVPVGLQTVHMSVDVTDIGKYSMTPAAMVTNLGYPPNLFVDDGTRIKPSDDLEDLPHIETQEIDVNVIPFWGDESIYDIGITRQDFRIRAVLVNTFYVFGTSFTDGADHMWGGTGSNEIKGLYLARNGDEQMFMDYKRTTLISENIYYYPPSVPDDIIPYLTDINSIHYDPNGNKFLKLDKSEYSVYKRDGDFVYIISCNRRKVITSEDGTELIVGDDNPNGIYTQFKGFFTFEYTEDNLALDFRGEIDGRPLTPFRYKFKFPQYAEKGQTFAFYNNFIGINTSDAEQKALENTIKWRHIHKTFSAGNYYTISKFQPIVFNNNANDSNTYNQGFLSGDYVNNIFDLNERRYVGLLYSELIEFENIEEEPERVLELPYNYDGLLYGIERKIFGGNWLNFALHFPQVGNLNPSTSSSTLRSTKVSTHFTIDFRRSTGSGFPSDKNYFNNNFQPIAAGDINTKWFARSDLHWCDFVEVKINDLVKIKDKILDGSLVKKGFDIEEFDDVGSLESNYRNGIYTNPEWNVIDPCPLNGGKEGINPLNPQDPNTYFYRGRGGADCIQYLYSLGLI